MNKFFTETIGWYGFFAIFIGYLLVSFNVFSPHNLIYLLLNITGSLGLGMLTFKKKAWSLTVFEFTWAIIGILSLIRII